MKYLGRYSATSYEVVKISEDGIESVVFTAGNSKLDSQIYVTADKGVGIDRMRSFCEITTTEYADENKGEYVGVEIDEDE